MVDIWKNWNIEDGRKQYRYIFGINEWKRTGILLSYYTEASSKYEKYEEIMEEEALLIIEEQKLMYKSMFDAALNQNSSIKEYMQYLYDYICRSGGFENIETNIVALLYCSYTESDFKGKNLMLYTKRIINSVHILLNNADLTDEKQLINLRVDNNANQIKRYELQELINFTNKNIEVYQRAYEFLGK